MSLLDIKHHRRTLFLIDGPSLYLSARCMGIEIDYRKLHEFTQAECPGARVVYHNVVNADTAAYSSVHRLMTWLDNNGYGCKPKAVPTADSPEDLARGNIRGGVLVELAVDILRAAQSVDELVLFSADGDLACAVRAAQDDGLRVTVVSNAQGRKFPVETPLRRAADSFLDIETIRDAIRRDDLQARSDDQGGGDGALDAEAA